MSDKSRDPYTAPELKALLIERVRQRYNNDARDGAVDSVQAQLVSDLSEAADPGRLAVALIEAIAELWDENNRRLREKDRRTSFAAGKRY